MTASDRQYTVCYLINQLAPGGAPTLLLEIVRNAPAEVDFLVCFIEGDDALVEEFERAGARVIDFDASVKFDPRSIARMVSCFRREDIDILHTHLPYADTLGRIVGKVIGVPHIVSTKHNFPERFHPVSRLLEWATRPIDDVTVAISDGVKESFRSQSRRDDHEWRTIYNGIDIEAFRDEVQRADTSELRSRWDVDEDDFIAVNVARYNPAKGQRYLVSAAEQVVEEIPNARIFIVGWGDLESDLNVAVKEKRLEDNVTVTGRVPTVYEYYALADTFVLPSVIEGFGIVLLEAMAASLPVVASDIPGAREVVSEGETGLLVPPGSPSELADAICAIDDPDRARSFGDQGYERALRTFDIEHTVDSHVALYRQLRSEDG